MSLNKIISLGRCLKKSLQVRYQSVGVLEHVKLSEEVAQARADGRPLLALESTIITHGMPYPQNLETAVQVEDIVRQQGAVPATIAILKGQLTVGLDKTQLQYLSTARGVVKASRRDLAAVVAARLDGATTVAGTIVAAELVGIPVFATGGIGGVHREGERTFDISADLTELGRCRTLVVCSGVKSILDIGLTLEYLETQGVSVCAFGEHNDFPAFYTKRSGHLAPHRVRDATEAARLLNSALDMKLQSGIVVAVPVPDQYSMDEKVIEGAIKKALKDAKDKGLFGKEVTPFLLAAVLKATEGASLKANIALIKNNAKVGADIAVQLNRLRNPGPGSASPSFAKRGFHTSCKRFAAVDQGCGGTVVVIGGANVDRTYRVTENNIKLDGSTHACITNQCRGGVGRNMAEALWKLRGPGSVRLVSAVGNDVDGHYLVNHTPGLFVKSSIIKGQRTPSYTGVLDTNGECTLGLGDMRLHEHITPEMIDQNRKLIENASLVVMDGNPPLETIEHVIRLCNEAQIPVFFEPTDRRKAIKPLIHKHQINFASPNRLELQAMANALNINVSQSSQTDIDEIVTLSIAISDYVKCLIVTLGEVGVVIVKITAEGLKGRLYPVKKLSNVRNVSGAGDCFASGFINGLLSGFEEEYCVAMAFSAAQQALLSESTVPTQFVEQSVYKSPFVDLI